MKEKRQHERFTIPLPVRLETITLGRKKVLDFEIRDISASGIFITTLSSFPEGTRFIIDLTIPSGSIKELTAVKGLMECTGTLVRSTSEGIAIQCGECEII